MKMITAQSSDTEILRAIDEAGNHRLPWRGHDWPEKEGEKAWVIPRDIGVSRGSDTRLLKRLRQLVAAGKLEERPCGSRQVVKRTWTQKITVIRGMPRFRVRRIEEK